MGYRKIKLDCASVCSDARSRGQSCHCANLLIMLILRDKNSVLILCIIVVAVFFLSRVVFGNSRLGPFHTKFRPRFPTCEPEFSMSFPGRGTLIPKFGLQKVYIAACMVHGSQNYADSQKKISVG